MLKLGESERSRNYPRAKITPWAGITVGQNYPRAGITPGQNYTGVGITPGPELPCARITPDLEILL